MPKYTVLSKNVCREFLQWGNLSVNVLYTCYKFEGSVIILPNVMGVCRGKLLMCYTAMRQKSKGGQGAV